MLAHELSSFQRFSDALETAQRVTLSSYIIPEATAVLLEAAAKRGAQVTVCLSGHCFGPAAPILEAANRAMVAKLQVAGVQAQWVKQGSLHLKAALVDDVGYLDDRNWANGEDVIVRDTDPTELALLKSEFSKLLTGQSPNPQSTPLTSNFALDKGDALRLEERVLASASTEELDVASETLGPCVVSSLLRTRAAAQPVKLLISKAAYEHDPRMQKEVQTLKAAGVTVRLGMHEAKMAISQQAAWLGSANATTALPQMLDWGLVLCDQASRNVVQAFFQSLWQKARPLAEPCAKSRA